MRAYLNWLESPDAIGKVAGSNPVARLESYQCLWMLVAF